MTEHMFVNRAMPTADDRRRDYRAVVRSLDECLMALEDAHERGETFVSLELVARLRPRVPWVTAQMRIADALERVFDEQAAHLPQLSSAPWSDDGDVEGLAPAPAGGGEPVAIEVPARQPRPEPLDVHEARRLTERIKSGLSQTCMLLWEAHDRRAWATLGYRTWEQYVRAEFGLSRRRSYELLDQAHVIRSVHEAAGTSASPDISAYAASQVKPHLPALTAEIRRRAAGLPEPEAQEVVGQVVRELRGRAPRRAPAGPAAPAPGAGPLTPAQAFREALDALTRMRAVPQMVVALEEEPFPWVADAERARDWLTELLWAWQCGGATRDALEARPPALACAAFRTWPDPAGRLPGARSA